MVLLLLIMWMLGLLSLAAASSSVLLSSHLANATHNSTTISSSSTSRFIPPSSGNTKSSFIGTTLPVSSVISSSHSQDIASSSPGIASYIIQGISPAGSSDPTTSSPSVSATAASSNSLYNTSSASLKLSQLSTVQVLSISIVNSTSTSQAPSPKYTSSNSTLSHHAWTAPSAGYGVPNQVNQTLSAATGTAAPSTITNKAQLSSVSRCPQLSLADWKPPVSIGGERFGQEWISSCQIAGHAYWAANSSFYAALRANAQSEVGVSQSPVEWNSTAINTGGVYTLCDGYPRFNNNEPLWQPYSTSYFFSGFINVTTTSQLDPIYHQSCMFNGSSPSFSGTAPAECSSIPSSACASLWDEWSLKYSTVGGLNDQIPYGCPLSQPGNPVICNTWFADQGTSTQQEAWCGTGPPPTSDFPCTIGARTVDIFYWPPYTRNGDLCTDGTTFTASNGTRLAYHTYTGNAYNATIYTFTSPTVYLSFDVLTATYAAPGHAGGEWVPGVVGRAFYDKIVGIDPDAVSSVVAHVPGFQGSWQEELSYIIGHSDVSLTLTAEPYNWAHVEFPYPASAYFFGHDTSWLSNMYWWSVSDRHSDTIYWMDGWLPTMSVPPELRSLDPAWASCAPILAGIHDPPTVITAVNTAFGPSLPTVKPTTTPAAPADSPKPKPKSTPVPQPVVPTPSPNQSKSNSATAMQPEASPKDPTTKFTSVDSPAASDSGDNGGTIVLPLDGSTVTASKTVVTGGNGVQTTQVIVAGQTMVQGGSAVTISSHTVSLATNGVVIDGHEPLPVPEGSQESAATLTLDGTPVPVTLIDGTAQNGQASSQAIVDGSTLTVGGPAITIGTQVVSLAPGGLVIDGSITHGLDSSLQTPNVVASATITLPSAQITATDMLVTNTEGVTHSVALIGSQTLQPGGTPIITAGHTISLGSSAIIVDGVGTIPFTMVPADTQSQAVLDLGSTSLSVVELTSLDIEGHSITEAVAAGTTLTPGAAAIIDGHVVAFESGHIVVDGRTTQSFEPTAISKPQAVANLDSAEVAASEIITTGSSGQVSTLAVVDGTTLHPGSTATIDGHVIQFQSGQLIIDGSKTVGFTSPASAFGSVATVSVNPSLTLSAFETMITGGDGSTTEEAIIGTATLLAGGPAVTVDGEVISLANDGSLVVNGTETISFSPLGNSATASVTSGHVNNEIKATSNIARPTTATSVGSSVREPPVSLWPIACFALCLLIML